MLNIDKIKGWNEEHLSLISLIFLLPSSSSHKAWHLLQVITQGILYFFDRNKLFTSIIITTALDALLALHFP